MFNEIFEKIKKYKNIVIVRHIGADPDALSSQLALRDSIRLTFPKKNVYAWGGGNARFNYLPNMDSQKDLDDVLLIITDTPDRKRIDFNWSLEIADSIKIDHHPFIEKICNLEYIDDTASSASEIVLDLINKTPLNMNDDIAKTLYTGIVSDTNRFMFNASSKLFKLVSDLLKEYNIDTTAVYNNIYSRPLEEVRLEGYIAQNMTVTKNKFGYVKITNEVLNSLSVDVGSAGNMINNFNYIDKVIAWMVVTEDVKNKLYKANIRSRGPIINKIAENYNGGGHKLASGAKVKTLEEVEGLIEDLDKACHIYLKEGEQ